MNCGCRCRFDLPSNRATNLSLILINREVFELIFLRIILSFQLNASIAANVSLTNVNSMKQALALSLSKGGRHSSVDSSDPTILSTCCPRFESQAQHIRFFNLLSYCVLNLSLYCEMDQKRGPFFLKKLSLSLHFQNGYLRLSQIIILTLSSPFF